jgi:hypothetical protein
MHMPIPKPPQQQTLHEEELTSTSPEDKSGSSCAKVDPDFPKQIVPHLNTLRTSIFSSIFIRNH